MLSTKTIEKRPGRPSGSKKLGRPLASDGEQTRTRILAAAQVCFAKHGFRETTNKMIAHLANLTPGTIYHYFTNKQDLFLVVHEEIQKSVLEAVQTGLAVGGTFAESMDRMLKTLMDLYVEHRDWIGFNSVVRTEARRNPEISTARNDTAWRAIYRKLATTAAANGEIDPDNVRAMQAVLSAIVLGLTQHGIEATPQSHADCIRGISLLLRGFLVKPSRKANRALVRKSL
jgi:AcrR family transcriptional regulator